MYKHIKVETEVHEMAKELARKNGMTLQGFIKKLVNDAKRENINNMKGRYKC